MHNLTGPILIALVTSFLVVPAVSALAVDPAAPALPASDLGHPLSLPDAASLPESATNAADAKAGLEAAVSADAGLAGVSAHGSASASADGAVVHAVDTGPLDATAVAPASFSDHVVAVAAPAAGSAIIATGLASLALGADALRLLQARLAALLGRGARAVARLVWAIPLFSRIERASLLDNPVRARVHDAIAQDPGLSLTEVTSRAGVAWGTAVHHLRRLESHGLVVSQSQLGHRRYYVANSPAALQRTAVAVVMHPTARRIAHLVSARPGIDQTGICQTLGLNNPAASKHLSQFEAQGLVQSTRSGRSRLYHPTGGLHSALQLLEPEPVLVQSYPMPGQSVAAAW